MAGPLEIGGEVGGGHRQKCPDGNQPLAETPEIVRMEPEYSKKSPKNSSVAVWCSTVF